MAPSFRASLALTTILCALSHHGNALTDAQAKIFTDNGVTVVDLGTEFRLEHHGVPKHDTGPFGDNPNQVSDQDHNYTLAKSPVKAATPGCLPMGAIGLAINGVALFNPYTIELENAVEGEFKEEFDACDGHPQQTGMYHYHQIPSCLYKATPDQLLGVAFDGYPIYGPLDADGKNLTTTDLDFCHGKTYNGEYRYHMTYDFPYILGCYTGEVDYDEISPEPPMGGNRPPPNGGNQRPPPGGDRPPPGGDRQPTPGGMAECVYANATNLGSDNNGGDGGDGGDTSGAVGQAGMVYAVLGLTMMALAWL